MNTSIVVHVSDAPPLTLTVEELASVCEPLAARRPAPQPAAPLDELLACALGAIEEEHGGVAFALDLSDDLGPHWVEWIEWLDTRERHPRHDRA